MLVHYQGTLAWQRCCAGTAGLSHGLTAQIPDSEETGKEAQVPRRRVRAATDSREKLSSEVTSRASLSPL